MHEQEQSPNIAQTNDSEVFDYHTALLDMTSKGLNINAYFEQYVEGKYPIFKA